MSVKKLSESQDREIVKRARRELVELIQHPDNTITSSLELGREYGVSNHTVNRILIQGLSKDERNFRKDYILMKTAKNNGQKFNPETGEKYCVENGKKNKKLTESQEREIVQRARRELVELIQHPDNTITSSLELGREYGVSSDIISRFLKKSELSEQEIKLRSEYIHSKTSKIAGRKPRKSPKRDSSIESKIKRTIGGLSGRGREIDDVRNAVYDFIYFDDTPQEIASNYGVRNINKWVRKFLELGYISDTEFRNAKDRRKESHYEKVSKKLSGRTISESTREKLRIGKLGKRLDLDQILAISNSQTTSRKRFELDGIYYASISEAGVAQLLKKYVSNFNISAGNDFQVVSENGKIFDFILDGAVFEWHPPNLVWDLSREDFKAYYELRRDKRINKKDRYNLEDEMLEEAFRNYSESRREALSNSRFKEYDLIISKSVRDFYDNVLLKFGENVPDYRTVHNHFRYYCSRVKEASEESDEQKNLGKIKGEKVFIE